MSPGIMVLAVPPEFRGSSPARGYRQGKVYLTRPALSSVFAQESASLFQNFTRDHPARGHDYMHIGSHNRSAH